MCGEEPCAHAPRTQCVVYPVPRVLLIIAKLEDRLRMRQRPHDLRAPLLVQARQVPRGLPQRLPALGLCLGVEEVGEALHLRRRR